nr:hypothetical protein BaRGS_003944 [Batillaria attramentaria]
MRVVHIQRYYAASPLAAYYRNCRIDQFIAKTLHVGDLYLIIETFTQVIPGPDGSSLKSYWTPSSLYTTTMDNTLTPTIFPTPTQETTPSSVTTTPSTTTKDPTLYFRMSFEVLNMTWTSGLGNNKSSIFRFYNVNFCRQLNQWLPGPEDKDFKHYQSCQIDTFSGDPLRVNFILTFRTMEGLNFERIERLVTGMIKELARRYTILDVLGYHVGEDVVGSPYPRLLVDLKSGKIHEGITTINPYDAIGYEFVYNIFPGNFSRALLDKSSYEFKEAADGLQKTLTFTLVFKENKKLDPNRLSGFIEYSKAVVGVPYLTIGHFLVTSTETVTHFYLMLDTMTTHVDYRTTTPQPDGMMVNKKKKKKEQTD